MLDAVLNRIFGSILESIAHRLGKAGAFLALAGFVVGLAAIPLIALHLYWIALAVFAVSRLFSALAARLPDATVAVFDAVNLAAVPFGFALGDPSQALAATFFVFAISALNASALKFGRGWIGHSELFVAFAIASILPGRFAVVAYVTGVLCFVSAGARLPRRTG